MTDMEHSWYRLVYDIITGVTTYGAGVYFMQYKRRVGPDQKAPERFSKHTDGLWGWRQWAPRHQDTWEGWKWDEDDKVTDLIQLDTYRGAGPVDIPLDQCTHFVLEGGLADPEGESLLRAAYPAYYGLKHADDWIGILIERMGGIPVFKVSDPDLRVFDAGDPDMVALRTYLEDAVTAIRIDEQMGIVAPNGIEFSLVTPSMSIEDVESYIRLQSWRILGSVLAQFLELGQAPRGSYAKSESDREFFMMAEEAILQHVVADTINRQEVPRLFGLNAGSFRGLEELPYFVPSDLVVPSIADLATPLRELAQGMIITPGPALEEHVRDAGKLPKEEEAEEVGKKQEEEDDEEHDHKGGEHWTRSEIMRSP
jgi:hypothetical protein